eukprot:scaffold114780_cov16-Tisochrysis_lutea.AAC.2
MSVGVLWRQAVERKQGLERQRTWLCPPGCNNVATRILEQRLGDKKRRYPIRYPMFICIHLNTMGYQMKYHGTAGRSYS